MEHLDKITLHKRHIQYPNEKAHILSDLHLGLGESSTNQFDASNTKEIVTEIEKITSQNTNKLILNGDILHKFDNISGNTKESIQKLRKNKNFELIFVKGNHDTLLSSIVPTVTKYNLTPNITVAHGHTLPDESQLHETELLIVGHYHPTLNIHGSTWPCFLYKEEAIYSTDVLILPAFNEYLTGVPVHNITSLFDTPLIEKGAPISTYKPIVYTEEETLSFPAVENIPRT